MSDANILNSTPRTDPATARGQYADWMEERLAELAGWEEMSRQDQKFLTAYACLGSKAEACRFVNRSDAWCHDRRFRSNASMELVTPWPNSNTNYILESRDRLLREATSRQLLKGGLKLDYILDAKPGKASGVTASQQLRAITMVLKAKGLIR